MPSAAITAAGRPDHPELSYQQIKDGKVSDATRAAIHRTGCAVVRGVFPATQATECSRKSGAIRGQRVRAQGSRKAQPRLFLGAEVPGSRDVFNVYWSPASPGTTPRTTAQRCAWMAARGGRRTPCRALICW